MVRYTRYKLITGARIMVRYMVQIHEENFDAIHSKSLSEEFW